MYKRNKKRMNKRNTIGLVALVLSVVALLSAIFGVFTPRSATSGDEIGLFAWQLGTVGDDGKIDESKESIVTKDLYAVKDMEISIENKADITYDLVFYDEDEKYISTLSGNSEDFDYDDASVVTNAKYFRVIINPVVEDEDEEIKLNVFNMYQYVKQITVTV